MCLLAGAAGGAARSRTVLEYKHYSLVMTEPLFNFEAVRTATEEVGGSTPWGIPGEGLGEGWTEFWVGKNWCAAYMQLDLGARPARRLMLCSSVDSAR
jgi:hypothetical protein